SSGAISVRRSALQPALFPPFSADLSIRKPSSFFPPLIAATSQRGFAPRPAQVSPDGPRYFGGTFFPFKALPPRNTVGFLAKQNTDRATSPATAQRGV